MILLIIQTIILCLALTTTLFLGVNTSAKTATKSGRINLFDYTVPSILWSIFYLLKQL